VSTHGRTRDLVNMAKDVGLEVVGHYIKQNRVCIDTRAENGVEASFSLSNSSRSDVRGDLNEQSRMKRFARANALKQEPEETMQRETIKLKDSTAAAQELTPIEFYKLCEYIKSMDVSSASSLEVLTRGAASHLGATVSEASVREAMTATGTADPECWTPLAEPIVIVARELALLLEQLGHAKSSQLTRFLETVK
jgi:hypothetical protein